MTCMQFTIREEPTGWFIQGHDSLGPFFSRERAMDLAEGMVCALRAVGEDAEIVVPDAPVRSFARNRQV